MKKLLLFLGLFIPVINSLNAQALDHIQGQILIQVQEEKDLRSIISRFTPLRRANIVSQLRSLSPENQVFALDFDFVKYHEGELLEKIRKHPKTIAAQFNHFISTRQNIPNDPQFSSQWQWLNNGINGKTKNLDTKAFLAWNSTTGGHTKKGKEIVVAIIDDGTEPNHPDLINNTWINSKEIPGNKIDDDQNGYIDDYHGWNILASNDSVDRGEHGVSVNGLIGAAGNNQTGVTGVNWDVKMMNLKYDVRQGIKESDVLTGYLYVLNQRKLYNKSLGQAGAFVVATNASWGIDNGKPADAPLWCGIYDSLGKAGILNVGAADNRIGVNVDSVGDLPSLCPSDYFIAVTSIASDGKRTGAYGVKNIDIAAPGDQIFTTRPNGTYGFDSGTSFSAPVVAGSIGLLYANSCEQLDGLVFSNPGLAALLVRSALLSSTDSLSTLKGLINTGGSLNILRALDAIQKSCLACTSRGTESRIYIDSIILDGLKFKSRDNFGYGGFTGIDTLKPSMNLGGQMLLRVFPFLKDSLTQYYLRVWIDRNHDQDFDDTAELVWDSGVKRLTGNLVSNIYLSPTKIDSAGETTLRISLKAATNIGDTSKPGPCDIFNAGEVEDYTIKLLPRTSDCPDVLELDSTAVFETSAVIFYQRIIPKLFYMIRYRESSNPKWDTLPTRDTMVRLDMLKKCTEYIVESKTFCDSDTSRFKTMFRFRTTGCSTVALNQWTPFDQVNVFPNPFVQRFTVQFNTKETLEKVQARLVSLTGSIIQNRSLGRLSQGFHEINFESSGSPLPQGIYFVQLQSHKGTFSKKVIRIE